MHKLKQFLAVIFILISLVMLVGCVAGVVGIWIVKQPMRDRTARALDSAERALNISVDALGQVHSNLAQAREDLKTAKQTVNAPQDMGFFNRIVAQTAVQRLGPNVQKANVAIDNVWMHRS